MKLKQLFSIIIITIIAVFIVNSLIFTVSNNILVSIKDVENQSSQLISDWYKLVNSKTAIITDRVDFGDQQRSGEYFYTNLKKEFDKNINYFEVELKNFTKLKSNIFLDNETKETISKLDMMWVITKGYFNDFGLSITDISKSEDINKIFHYGLMSSNLFKSSKELGLSATDVMSLNNIMQGSIYIDSANDLYYATLLRVKNNIFEQSKNVHFITSIVPPVVSLLIIILVSVFIFLTNKQILSRIIKIENTLKKVANMDLTVRADFKSNDEISQTGKHLNEIIDKILGFIKKVKQSSNDVKSMNEYINSGNTESISALEEISRNLESIKVQISNLDNSIISSNEEIRKIGEEVNDFSENIQKQTSSISESSSSIAEMTEILTEVENISSRRKKQTEMLLKITKEGQEKLVVTNDLIKTIASDIKNILDIISVINNVSSQTNILSMNAAIESAHAGEYGHGFSVVADEIRKLAESTSANAKNISESLKSITTRINQTLNASDISLKSFGNINSEIDAFVNDMENISNNIVTISGKNKLLLNRSEIVTSLNEDIKQSFSNIQNSANNIQHVVKNITGASSEVTTGISEIDTGAKEVLKEIISLNEISNNSREQVEELNKLILEYKTDL